MLYYIYYLLPCGSPECIQYSMVFSISVTAEFKASGPSCVCWDVWLPEGYRLKIVKIYWLNMGGRSRSTTNFRAECQDFDPWSVVAFSLWRESCVEIGGNTADMFEDVPVPMTCSLVWEDPALQPAGTLPTFVLHRSSLSFARPFHQLIGFLRCSCRRLAVGCFTAGSQTIPFDWLACLHFGPSAFVCGKLYVEFKHSFFMCLNVYVCICCENWIQHRTSVIS